MILFRRSADIRAHLQQFDAEGKKTGFVPTMGALHAGHISLIEQSRATNDITVASIFVNPTQFNDPKDYAAYPVTIPDDLLQLGNAGCDIVFLPEVNEIYPGGTAPSTRYAIGDMEYLLEGEYRPGHFQGVCQVVHRLLDIIQPDQLIMGRKDYQQCMVVAALIHALGLQVQLITAPTRREASGLAMSSRNRRLSSAQKEAATVLSKALQQIRQQLQPGPTGLLIQQAVHAIRAAGFESVDYVSIADAHNLQPVADWDGQQPLVALVAASIGGVRLIDNLPLSE
jgi:pantoate--beta-alanine ligase